MSRHNGTSSIKKNMIAEKCRETFCSLPELCLIHMTFRQLVSLPSSCFHRSWHLSTPYVSLRIHRWFILEPNTNKKSPMACFVQRWLRPWEFIRCNVNLSLSMTKKAPWPLKHYDNLAHIWFWVEQKQKIHTLHGHDLYAQYSSPCYKLYYVNETYTYASEQIKLAVVWSLTFHFYDLYWYKTSNVSFYNPIFLAISFAWIKGETVI
jgi:hypothetical protein